MGPSVRSKKMAVSAASPGSTRGSWTYPAENGPHRAMADRIFRLDRRELLAGLGAAAARARPCPRIAAAQGRPVADAAGQSRRHRPASGSAGYPDLVASGRAPDPVLRFKRGDELEITLRKRSAGARSSLNWHGIDGVAAAEPLAARSPLAAGARETLAIPLRHAGTLLCDLRLLGDGQARPLAGAGADRRRERARRGRPRRGVPDRRLAAARRTAARSRPGIDPKDATPLYTVNGPATPGYPAARQ